MQGDGPNNLRLQMLYQAMEFASFLSKPDLKFDGKPDRPYSLYEGIIGGVHFCFDVLFGANDAKFPAYEIPIK